MIYIYYSIRKKKQSIVYVIIFNPHYIRVWKRYEIKIVFVFFWSKCFNFRHTTGEKNWKARAHCFSKHSFFLFFTRKRKTEWRHQNMLASHEHTLLLDGKERRRIRRHYGLLRLPYQTYSRSTINYFSLAKVSNKWLLVQNLDVFYYFWLKSQYTDNFRSNGWKKAERKNVENENNTNVDR
jgi:hypothetical protein